MQFPWKGDLLESPIKHGPVDIIDSVYTVHQFQELVLQFDAGNAEFERSKVVSNKAAIYFSAAWIY